MTTKTPLLIATALFAGMLITAPASADIRTPSAAVAATAAPTQVASCWSCLVRRSLQRRYRVRTPNASGAVRG